MKKNKIRKNGYSIMIILTIISMIIFIVGCIYIFKSFSFFEEKKKSTLETKRNITYKIKTKDKKYYKKETLKEKKEFIAPAIKEVIPRFLVIVKNDTDENIKCTYEIKGKLNAYSNNKIIKSKDYDIVKKKTITLEDPKNTKIEEEFEIDYKNYQEETDKIKKETGKVLNYTLTLEMNLKTNNKKDTKEDTLKLDIPITKQNKKISLKKIYPQKEKRFIPKIDIKIKNKNYLIGGISIILGSIIIFLVSLITIKRRREIRKIRKRIKNLKANNRK